MLPKLDHNAAYIWAIYGLGALGLAAMTLSVWLKARAARKRLDRLESLEKS